ncbi:hypothetical protein F4776DRAFT_493019 [Hypoxylon sp. NC0597]|nr:hypothetical protein F4776DRAFT_493019 [Hypoxylon sp. NC0597]
MASTRNPSTTLGHQIAHEPHELEFGRIRRVLVQGIMIGGALFFPAALQYEDTFYQYLALCIFFISTVFHIALNWKVVSRYFLLALVTIAMLFSIVTLPYSEGSIPLLLGGLSILVMLMGLFIEEYFRCFAPNSRYWERAPDHQLLPTDAGSDAEKPVPLTPGRRDELLVHMNGGEKNQYSASSQVSSEISLSNIGSGRLPSSCDTMTRAFWHDDEIEDRKRGREDEERESQTKQNLS